MSAVKPEEEVASRADLECEAEIAKGRLLRTLDAIDHERHHVEEVVDHARHGALVPAIAGGAVIGLVAIETLRIVRRRRNRATPFVARFHAVKRAWAHPGRVAPGDSLGGLVERVAVSALTAMVAALATRFATRALTRSGEGTR